MSPTTTVPLAHAPTATLVVISAEEETAKRVESRLRNSGHPVRTAWLNELEDFEDLLHRSPPDLVLTAINVSNIAAPDVVRLCARFAPDLPTVFLAAKPSTPAETAAALNAGARDRVSLADEASLAHLEQVCLRELRGHYLRRELRQTRARLADFELRHRSLLAGTADAVVHVQEGIITHANAAFTAMLGHATPEALNGNPLMDFVAAGGQASIKTFLKQVAQGKLPKEAKIELSLQKGDGGTVDVSAKATLGQNQGERLLELLIRAPAREKEAAAAPAAPPSGRAGLMQMLGSAIKTNVDMHRALTVVMVDAFASIEQRLGYQALLD